MMNNVEFVVEQHESNSDDIYRWLRSITVDNHNNENHTKDDRLKSDKHAYSILTADDSMRSHHAKSRRHADTENERQRQSMQEKFVSFKVHKISKRQTGQRRHHSHDYSTPKLDSRNSRRQSDTHSCTSPSSSIPTEPTDNEQVDMGLQVFENDIQAYRDDMAATMLMLCHLDHIKGVKRDDRQAKFPAIQSLLNDSIEPQYTPSPSPEVIAASIQKSQAPGYLRSTSLF